MSSCAGCHADVADQEAGRAHALAGVGCTECHGGDATQPTAEAAHAESAGFRGALGAVAVVNSCGECHADVETINPYGLPTDQLAQYRTSEHGRALFEQGDERVATCASCHGAHGILGPRSSASPVHPASVPATCGSCHAEEELMGGYGIDAGIPEAWHRSVHADLLLEQGDLSAPECATCHGSHGAVPPGFRDVAAVCGKCHVREKELFEESPHAALVDEGDFPGCAVCHSNHDVRPATLEILDRMCDLCHAGEEDPISSRDRMVAGLRALDERLVSTRAELQDAATRGLVTDEDRLLLDEVETTRKGARVLLHALDAGRLEEVTAEGLEALERLSASIAAERREQRLKRRSVLPVVAFLTVMSIGFWVRQRRIHGRAGGAKHGRRAT